MTIPESDPGAQPGPASPPPAGSPYGFPQPGAGGPPPSDPYGFPQPGPGGPPPSDPYGFPQPGPDGLPPGNPYGFAGGPPGMPFPGPMDGMRRRAMQQIRTRLIIGVVLLVVGLAITIVTYGNAATSPAGGTYFVAWGPMLVGVLTIIRALISMSKLPRQ